MGREDDAGENGIKALAPRILAKVRQRARMDILFGAFGEDRFCRALVHAMHERVELNDGQTRIIFQAYPPFDELTEDIQDLEIPRPALEQSNTALFFSTCLFLKGSTPRLRWIVFWAKSHIFHMSPKSSVQCSCSDTAWPLPDLLVIEKNLKSLQQEMRHRPDWLPVPLFSLLRRQEAKRGGSQ